MTGPFYQGTSLPAFMTFSSNQLSYRPQFADVGNYTIVFALNGQYLSQSYSFIVSVTNTAPTFASTTPISLIATLSLTKT